MFKHPRMTITFWLNFDLTNSTSVVFQLEFSPYIKILKKIIHRLNHHSLSPRIEVLNSLIF